MAKEKIIYISEIDGSSFENLLEAERYDEIMSLVQCFEHETSHFKIAESILTNFFIIKKVDYPTSIVVEILRMVQQKISDLFSKNGGSDNSDSNNFFNILSELNQWIETEISKEK